MAEHTPGPWSAVTDGDIEAGPDTADGLTIATVVEARSDEELRANQRLIAKAPEMYELLYYVSWTINGIDKEWLEQRRALLDSLSSDDFGTHADSQAKEEG